MLNPSTGWNSICNNMKERSSPSHTTATSSTTWPDGFWNSTAEKAYPGRATTPAGWNRRRGAWSWKKRLQASGARRSNANLNGCAWRPKPARPKERPDSTPTTSCSTKTRKRRKRSSKSSSPTDRAWATRSSRHTTCARLTATNCCSTTWNSCFRPTASWAS